VDGKGVARSKGFAFVEFSSHDAAVTALRATNNNPELFGSKKVSTSHLPAGYMPARDHWYYQYKLCWVLLANSL